MRILQNQGLHPSAYEFLKKQFGTGKQTVVTYVDGTEIDRVETDISNVYKEEYISYILFYQEIPLYQFSNSSDPGDSRIYYEVEQACPWSSGPCPFFCLSTSDDKRKDEFFIKETMWPQELIDNI